jgi:hypothetical protein
MARGNDRTAVITSGATRIWTASAAGLVATGDGAVLIGRLEDVLQQADGGLGYWLPGAAPTSDASRTSTAITPRDHWARRGATPDG